MDPVPATYDTTREALHKLAVYVISPARARHNPRQLALRATPGGFGTAPYGPAATVLRVDGDQLLIETPEMRNAEPITSIAAAARLAGIDPDTDQQDRYDVPPHGDLDATLPVDPDASRLVGAWFALATDALESLRFEARPEDAASIVRIWPEHFDAAIDLGRDAQRTTFGASAGDRHHHAPYLYVTRPEPPADDAFWNADWFSGAYIGYDAIASAVDPVAAAAGFYRDARRRVHGY
jgi:hypothetical protein